MMQYIIQCLLMGRRIFLLFLLTACLTTYVAVAAEGAEGSGGGNEGGNESPEGPESGNTGVGEGSEGPEGGNTGVGEGPEGPEGGNTGVGEGPEGPEGGNTGVGEGPEGPEGGNINGGTNVPFVSSGLSLGRFESPVLKPNETFAGLYGDTEIVFNYDEANEKFVGRIKNEAPDPVCDVKVAMIVDGIHFINKTFSGNPLQIDGLLAGGGQNFEFPVPGATRYLQSNPNTSWTMEIETFSCSSAPTTVAGNTGSGSNAGECSGSPAGNEGGGESGNESGGGESANEAGGSEGGNQGGIASGDESSPAVPIADAFSGIFQNQNFTFAYDNSTQAFRGTVENITNNFVCLSRTEVHLGVGTQVVELGPTIPENLAPGKTLQVVVAIDGVTPDTYTLHPEASPCP